VISQLIDSACDAEEVSTSPQSKSSIRARLAFAVFCVVAIVVVMAAGSFSWCVVIGRDPGPAGQQLLELVRLVLGAGILR